MPECPEPHLLEVWHEMDEASDLGYTPAPYGAGTTLSPRAGDAFHAFGEAAGSKEQWSPVADLGAPPVRSVPSGSLP